MAKIYTKFGDHGETALVGGQKISKSDTRIDAYGTVDELNSVLGLARAALGAATRAAAAASSGSAVDGLSRLNADLETLQHWLFDLGSLLASSPKDRQKYALPPMRPEQVSWLEERIDAATAVLNPLKNFILPAGDEAACRLHVARTVARRAERLMVEMKSDLPEQAIPFVNRLSDYLFVMARFVNHLLGIEDVLWKKTEPSR